MKNMIIKDAKKAIRVWRYGNGYGHKDWTFQNLARYMATFAEMQIEKHKAKNNKK